MKEILKKKKWFGISILFICIVVSVSCDASKRLNQKGYNWSQSTYIDSVVFKMPHIQILSDELKKMIDTLILEASIYEPLKGFPDYPGGISVSTNSVPNNFIKLSFGKNYIMSNSFPDAEKNNPFYPDIFPLIPSMIGLSIYKGYQIDYLWTMEYFVSDNEFGKYDIIKVDQDSIELIAYAPRKKETNEWVYMLMPSVTLYCEVVGDNLVFRKFEYDAGRIKYLK